jgi:hypothetical protein
MILRHCCNIRCCANLDYLVPGTRAENNADTKAAHLHLTDARAATAKAVPGFNSSARAIRIDGIELTGDVPIRVVDPEHW